MQASRGCCKIDGMETTSVFARNLTWESPGFTKGTSWSWQGQELQKHNTIQERVKVSSFLMCWSENWGEVIFGVLSEDHLQISAEEEDGSDCLMELGAMNRLNTLPSLSECNSAQLKAEHDLLCHSPLPTTHMHTKINGDLQRFQFVRICDGT